MGYFGSDVPLTKKMEKLAVGLFTENLKYCNEGFRRMDTGELVSQAQYQKLHACKEENELISRLVHARKEENELITRLIDESITDELLRMQGANSRKSKNDGSRKMEVI
jgi:hypothetical protein